MTSPAPHLGPAAERLDPAARHALDERIATRWFTATSCRDDPGRPWVPAPPLTPSTSPATLTSPAPPTTCTTWWSTPRASGTLGGVTARCRLEPGHRSPHVDTVTGDVALGHEAGLCHVNPVRFIEVVTDVITTGYHVSDITVLTLKQHRALPTCIDPGHLSVTGKPLGVTIQYACGEPAWCDTPAETRLTDVVDYALERLGAVHDHRTCGLCPTDVW